MVDRLIDFYIKGLPLDDRLEIWEVVERINPLAVEKLMEEPQDFPTYRSMGYTDEKIRSQQEKNRVRFRNANASMTCRGRRPFFSDPENTYRSALEYCALIKHHTDAELLDIFGCTWDEYVPELYRE